MNDVTHEVTTPPRTDIAPRAIRARLRPTDPAPVADDARPEPSG